MKESDYLNKKNYTPSQLNDLCFLNNFKTTLGNAMTLLSSSIMMVPMRYKYNDELMKDLNKITKLGYKWQSRITDHVYKDIEDVWKEEIEDANT